MLAAILEASRGEPPFSWRPGNGSNAHYATALLVPFQIVAGLFFILPPQEPRARRQLLQEWSRADGPSGAAVRV